jgi:hypothetical protein
MGSVKVDRQIAQQFYAPDWLSRAFFWGYANIVQRSKLIANVTASR